MADFDRLFGQFRETPWRTDPNGVPQEGLPGNGNPESTGWIADDAITADTIQANAVTAGKVDADAITAREIAANTITANEIAAATITGNEIAANSITSNHIVANTIEASDILANTITANEIAANTITANEIAANTITANEIAANTITASEIVADTITANEIAANAITATEIAANSIETNHIVAGNVTSGKIELTVSGKNFGANAGGAAAPGVYFDGTSTTGMYRTSGADIGFAIGGAVGFVIGESGRNQSQWSITARQDNVVSLGVSGRRWTEVWAFNGTIQTSDEREKCDIQDEPLGLDFIRSLRPRTYRWRDAPDTQAQESVSVDSEALEAECEPYARKIQRARQRQVAGEISEAEAEAIVAEAGARLQEIRDRHLAPALSAQQKRRPGKRDHHGLIAQEVKAALDEAGVDAAFWQEAPDGMQSLVYTELMAPMLRAIQELDERLARLEDRG